MQDRPSAPELLEAVAAFLTEEVARVLDGRARFHALVAANTCRIVAREIELSPAQLAAEHREILCLLEIEGAGETPSQERVRALNEELCARIQTGWADDEPRRSRLLAFLRARSADKLAVVNPKLLET